MPAGRPSEFTPAIGDAICDRLLEGQSLRKVCQADDMPAMSTVMKWLASGKHIAFVEQYTRTREMVADVDAEDIAHYARQAADGEIDPAAARTAIDGLKWSAGKRAPKRYGDSSTVRHAGAIGHFDASKYTDEQLAQLEGVLGPIAAAGGDAGRGPGGEGQAES